MGVGVVDSDPDGLGLVYSVVLRPSKPAPLSERLRYLYDQLERLVGEWVPSEVAIEAPFVARNVRTAMAVGQAQAVAMVAAARHDLPVETYSPREVKRAVTDYGGSSKAQVQDMISALLGLPDGSTLPSDAADAVAVAICHISASREYELVLRD